MISGNCCNFKELIWQTKNRYDHRRQSYWNILYGRWLLQVFWCNDSKIYAKTYRKKEISSKFYNVKGRSYADNDLFHDSGYRCFKHFYLEKVCKQLRHLFPKVVSYNRIVELERDAAVPLTLFIKKFLLGKCTGISFVDSTPLRVCKNQRIHIHKVSKA